MIGIAPGVAAARAALGVRLLAVGVALGTVVVVLAGILEGRQWPTRAADHTLAGAVFGVVVPLFAYACLGWATREGLSVRLGVVARYGADRRLAALGYLGLWAGVVALAGAWFAGVGVLAARGTSDPAVVGDVLVSTRIGLLGGLVYAACLGLGGALPAPRWWQLGFLAGDWLLGSSTRAVSAFWPRGHLRTLLGAEPVLGLSQRSASLALVGMAALAFGAALALTRR